MVMAILIGILSIGSAVMGHVLSRGVGVGISLFMAIWVAFLTAYLLGQTLPLKRVPEDDRITYANSIWFLWLIQILIWTTIRFKIDNDFGYVAKDNPFLLWVFPSALGFLTALSIITLIKGRYRRRKPS